MPAIKVKPPESTKKRDFWGDHERGITLANLITEKFGSKHGHVKHVLAYLKLQRRILDMYKSGERNIPDDIFKRLHLLPDYTIETPNDWANEEDPLS